MSSILCLAHYCDTHGPTPLMVTEGFPVTCSSCFDSDLPDFDRSSSHLSQNSSENIPRLSQSTNPSASASLERDSGFRKALQTLHTSNPQSSSAVVTPPESPKIAALKSARSANGHRRDSSFRKTYDENDRKRAIPCENCALTLPKKVKEPKSGGGAGTLPKNEKGDNSGPVMRTRTPYERISYAPGKASPAYTASDSDEAERQPHMHKRKCSVVLRRSATSSSNSSISSGASQSHTHFLDYTSTHDPLSSFSYSILRNSCLRTLSCETLPPSAISPVVTPTSPFSQKSFQGSSISPTLCTSGGPIFFGDPTAGYTTAYIFRIPDPYARGRRRVYAFMCLSTAHERSAMRAFSYLASAFRDLAAWIQTLAEQEADRADSHDSNNLRTQSQSARNGTNQRESYGDNKVKSNSKSAFTPPPPVTSSFLSGRGYNPDGFARNGASGIRSRGLAELVGRADFFIELHARFVALLAHLRFLIDGN